jgi:GTP cyclohydrolase IA
MKEEYEKVICKECGEKFYRITNTHLWKNHAMTMEEYCKKYPNALIESEKLAKDRVNYLRGKSYIEIYGKVDALKMIMQKEKVTQEHWDNNPERKDELSKQLTGRIKSNEEIKNMKKSKQKDWNNYNERAMAFYGEECQKCGAVKDLIVHHMDSMNLSNELGNHTLSNLMVLCKSCHAKLHNELNPGKFTGLGKIEHATGLILEALRDEFGLDLSDENFKDTPKRVARAYYEIFEGINSIEKLKRDVLSTSFPSDYKGMVIVDNINCFSMCPHHLLPVEYIIDIGYLPGKITLGISKLCRLVELLAKAPMLQETLTESITEVLDYIKPVGSMVRIRGRHLCMAMRGVKKSNSWTTTTSVRGAFKEQAETKNEFMELIKRSI